MWSANCCTDAIGVSSASPGLDIVSGVPSKGAQQKLRRVARQASGVSVRAGLASNRRGAYSPAVPGWTDIAREGWVARLPRAARPYAVLARFDRPIGAWLLFLPGLWSILLAPAAWEHQIRLILLF